MGEQAMIHNVVSELCALIGTSLNPETPLPCVSAFRIPSYRGGLFPFLQGSGSLCWSESTRCLQWVLTVLGGTKSSQENCCYPMGICQLRGQWEQRGQSWEALAKEGRPSGQTVVGMSEREQTFSCSCAHNRAWNQYLHKGRAEWAALCSSSSAWRKLPCRKHYMRIKYLITA